MKKALQIITASTIGILTFLTLMFVIGNLLIFVFSDILQSKIFLVLTRLMIKLIFYSWDETTAVSAILCAVTMFISYQLTCLVISKIGGENMYLSYKIVGILLLVLYIVLLIMYLWIDHPIFSSIFGIVVSACIYVRGVNRE